MYFCLTGIPRNTSTMIFRKVSLEDFKTAKLMIFELEELMSPQDAEEAAFKLGLTRNDLMNIEKQCQGNPKEHVNRIIEELISAKKDELTPTDILHVLLSMGRKEYTDVALRCHERCYFRKDRSISDDESRTEKTKRNSKTVVEVMI